MLVTREIYKNVRQLLQTNSVKDTVAKTKVSAATVSRIKASPTYKAYKELVKKHHCKQITKQAEKTYDDILQYEDIKPKLSLFNRLTKRFK